MRAKKSNRRAGQAGFPRSLCHWGNVNKIIGLWSGCRGGEALLRLVLWETPTVQGRNRDNETQGNSAGGGRLASYRQRMGARHEGTGPRCSGTAGLCAMGQGDDDGGA